MDEQNQWYVTIEGNAVGPVSTDLVIRGIKHKKIATNAYVCVVGASEWQSLADVAEFYDALSEGGLLDAAWPRNGRGLDLAASPADPLEAQASSEPALSDAEDESESETTASFPSQRAHELAAPAPATAADADGPTEATAEPRNGKYAEALIEGRPRFPSVDLDIDITVDDIHEASIDWNHGFCAYFLVDTEVKLPDEHALLHSFTTVPRETFLHDEAMWNLALCLAFGTDAVARAAADVFFDVVTAHELQDRIEWMCRTLLSRGFMPSGIPHAAGYRGLGQLQEVCPEGLLPKLESEIAS
jgi:hypothetical protein